jgi:hypothetical protein
MRVLIAALLLITTLAIAGNLAASYLALSRVASAWPGTLPQTPQVAVAAAPALVALPAPSGLGASNHEATGDDESESPSARGARAMQAAMAADPDIAALLDDQDPKVRSAMRAFFEDAPSAAAKP